MHVFSTDKKIINAGGHDYSLTGTWQFFKNHPTADKPENHDTSKADVETIKHWFGGGAGEYYKLGDKLTIIDIEHWPVDDAGRESTAQQFEIITKTMRAINPHVRIGLYSMVPICSFWHPVLAEDPAFAPGKKQIENDNVQNVIRLSQYFDVSCPCVYMFAEEAKFFSNNWIDSWKKYCDWMLSEAAKARKQTYAYVWPMLQEGATIPTPVPIPDQQWRLMLQHLKTNKNCDGVIVFDYLAKHDWQTAVIEECLRK